MRLYDQNKEQLYVPTITELRRFNDPTLNAENDAAKLTSHHASGAIATGFNLPHGEEAGKQTGNGNLYRIAPDLVTPKDAT